MFNFIKNKNLIKLAPGIPFAFFLFLFFPVVSYAEGFVPLADLGLYGDPSDFTGYASGMVTFLIYVTAVLAVIIITWGGIRYITSGGSQSGVEAGKEKIRAALLGLAIALGAWLLLSTINPDLLKFDLNLDSPGSVDSFEDRSVLSYLLHIQSIDIGNTSLMNRWFNVGSDIPSEWTLETHSSSRACEEKRLELMTDRDSTYYPVTGCAEVSGGNYSFYKVTVNTHRREFQVGNYDNPREARTSCAIEYRDKLDAVANNPTERILRIIHGCRSFYGTDE